MSKTDKKTNYEYGTYNEEHPWYPPWAEGESGSVLDPMPTEKVRRAEAPVNRVFMERWSPRSFDPDYELGEEQLRTLFEAARWAPSCFNEQPWRFHLARRGSPAFALFLEPLAEGNRVWARNASVLVYVVGRRYFSKSGKENTTFEFDCGSAWMSLTLQARLMGLYTHGMAGFDRDAAGKLLKTGRTREKVIAAFVVGKKDDPSRLPEELAQREKMSDRESLGAIMRIHDRIHDGELSSESGDLH